MTSAFVIYCLIMIAIPWILVILSYRAGLIIYNDYPGLREAAWDVKLALNTYMDMLLNYFLGIIFSAIACYKFIRNIRISN